MQEAFVESLRCMQVSLVMVVVGAVVFAYRRWAGLDKPLTIVTKQGDV